MIGGVEASWKAAFDDYKNNAANDLFSGSSADIVQNIRLNSKSTKAHNRRNRIIAPLGRAPATGPLPSSAQLITTGLLRPVSAISPTNPATRPSSALSNSGTVPGSRPGTGKSRRPSSSWSTSLRNEKLRVLSSMFDVSSSQDSLGAGPLPLPTLEDTGTELLQQLEQDWLKHHQGVEEDWERIVVENDEVIGLQNMDPVQLRLQRFKRFMIAFSDRYESFRPLLRTIINEYDIAMQQLETQLSRQKQRINADKPSVYLMKEELRDRVRHANVNLKEKQVEVENLRDQLEKLHHDKQHLRLENEMLKGEIIKLHESLHTVATEVYGTEDKEVKEIVLSTAAANTLPPKISRKEAVMKEHYNNEADQERQEGQEQEEVIIDDTSTMSRVEDQTTSDQQALTDSENSPSASKGITFSETQYHSVRTELSEIPRIDSGENNTFENGNKVQETEDAEHTVVSPNTHNNSKDNISTDHNNMRDSIKSHSSPSILHRVRSAPPGGGGSVVGISTTSYKNLSDLLAHPNTVQTRAPTVTSCIGWGVLMNRILRDFKNLKDENRQLKANFDTILENWTKSKEELKGIYEKFDRLASTYDTQWKEVNMLNGTVRTMKSDIETFNEAKDAERRAYNLCAHIESEKQLICQELSFLYQSFNYLVSAKVIQAFPFPSSPEASKTTEMDSMSEPPSPDADRRKHHFRLHNVLNSLEIGLSQWCSGNIHTCNNIAYGTPVNIPHSNTASCNEGNSPPPSSSSPTTVDESTETKSKLSGLWNQLITEHGGDLDNVESFTPLGTLNDKDIAPLFRVDMFARDESRINNLCFNKHDLEKLMKEIWSHFKPAVEQKSDQTLLSYVHQFLTKRHPTENSEYAYSIVHACYRYCHEDIESWLFLKALDDRYPTEFHYHMNKAVEEGRSCLLRQQTPYMAVEKCFQCIQETFPHKSKSRLKLLQFVLLSENNYSMDQSISCSEATAPGSRFIEEIKRQFILEYDEFMWTFSRQLYRWSDTLDPKTVVTMGDVANVFQLLCPGIKEAKLVAIFKAVHTVKAQTFTDWSLSMPADRFVALLRRRCYVSERI